MGKKLVIRIICLLLLSKGVVSQTVTLNVREVALEKVLADVERQTGVRFVYSDEVLADAKPVTLYVRKLHLASFLPICFDHQPIAYLQDGNYILLRKEVKAVAGMRINSMNMFRRGRVVDQDGLPVAGATLCFSGTGRQLTTDEKGEFVFSMAAADTSVLITSVEIDSIEVSVSHNDIYLLIRTQRKIGSLDESLVKGYYISTKRANTGSVHTIRTVNIVKQPGASLLQMIQGHSAGVYLNSTNGLPGSRLSVLIRGRNSIHGGTDPLILLDGMPVNPDGKIDYGIAIPPDLTQAGLLSGINPDAIYSIKFLKDADATAIYGARGGNGVILITTKRPESLKTGQELELNTRFGLSYVGRTSGMLNLSNYLEYRKEAFRNDGRLPDPGSAPDLLIWDQTRGADWKKILLGKIAMLTSLNGRYSVRGANLAATLDFQHQKLDAVHPGSRGYENYSFHLGANYRSSGGKFNIAYRGWVNSEENQPLSDEWITVLSLPPNFPMNPMDNPSSRSYVQANEPIHLPEVLPTVKTRFHQQQVVATLTPAEWMSAKLLVGMNRQGLSRLRNQSPDPINSSDILKSGPEQLALSQTVMLIEPQIDLKIGFGMWQLNGSLGATWQETVRKHSMQISEELQSERLVSSKFAALFGRVNWAYRKVVHLNLVLRRDGSSRLGIRNQYGNFGALGTAWIFTECKPFRSLSNLFALGKIRTSFGITGNDQLGDFVYRETFVAGHGYQHYTGWRPERFANPDIAWERIRKAEIALDLVGHRDRFELTLAYYHNISSNQVMERPVPFIAGPFGIFLTNVPSRLLNRGLEFDIGLRVVNNRQWNWDLKGNISLPKNKLLEYPSDGHGSNEFTPLLVGEDINSRWGYHFLRVDPLTGSPEFLDRNQDGLLSPIDMVKIGSTSPRYFGGLASELRYKGITVTLGFHYVSKYEMGGSPVPGTMVNLFSNALDRWKQPGDRARVPKASSMQRADLTAYAYSDAVFVNASFLRLRQASIAYNMGAVKGRLVKPKQMQWTIDAQNLFTWHKAVNLFDPETLNAGYPPLRTLQFGCRIVI